jgi:hypothetical protein
MNTGYRASVKSTGGETKQGGGVKLLPGTCFGYGRSVEEAVKELITWCPKKYWRPGEKAHVKLDRGDV